jgi:hypothetical protein
MKRKFLAFSTVALVVLLSGCGGGDSGDSSSNTGGTSHPSSIKMLDPIPAYTQSTTQQANGQTMSNKLGADGDFVVTKVGDYINLGLAKNIKTVDIVAMTKITNAQIGYTNGDKLFGTVSSDFLKGEQHLVGTVVHSGTAKDYDCVQKYSSILPLVIDDTNVYKVRNGVDGGTLISTTCPKDIAEDDNGVKLILKTYESSTNTIITDNNGKISHISEYRKLQ